MRNQRLINSAVIVILICLSASCRSSGTATPPQNGPQVKSTSPSQGSPEPEQSVRELIKSLPFIEKEKIAGVLHAWTRIPNHGHYRVARSSDFEIPSMTFDYGELAGAYGLAALIIDK